ncbi:MAG: GNAT family N-acetyltransferase [Ardenticatenaceae bacterium]
MSITIRPFEPTDTEYEQVIAIENAVWPDEFATVENMRHWDTHRDQNYLFEREVIEKDGQLVAFGAYAQWSWSFHPRKYWIGLRVHPDYEGQGIGSPYYEHVMALLLERDPIAITASTREDKPQAIRFLRKRGFEQTMREQRCELKVDTFDSTKFVGVLEKVRQSGIQIVTIRQLAEIDPHWKRNLYEAEWEIDQDVPSPDASAKRSFESFEKGALGSPNLLPDGWVVALDEGRYVGMSTLWRSANKEKLDTGLTGVVRTHRRRGIATALKVHGIQFAQQYGAKTIVTENEENNPMYQLNLILGYRPVPGWLDFEKTLGLCT